MFRKTIILLLLAILPAGHAHAYTFSAGVVGALGASPYKGDDLKYIAFPYVSFDSEYFFLSFPSAGVHLLKSDFLKLDAKVEYMFLKFKPKDNDHDYMKRLDSRRPTLVAGLEGEVPIMSGALKASIVVDVLDESNSVLGAVSYAYPFHVSEKLILTPKAGVIWANKKHNNYYFGVSHEESLKSGLRGYSTDDSWSFFAGGRMTVPVTKKFNFNLEAEYLFLPSEVKDSPMVNKNGTWGSYISLIYSF